MTTDTGFAAPTLPAYSAPQRVSQARVARSEWTKLRTQPSAVWALLSAVVLVVGFGVLYCLVRVTRPPHGAAAISSFDPAAISLAGINLAQLAVGVLGVLLISSEYATGLIRASFAAVPSRLPVLWGKAAVFALTTLTLCVPATFAAFLVGQSILSRQHLGTALGQPGVARAVLGGALYLGVVGLLGLGLGALLRSTAGAIASLFGVLFALQIVVGFLPGSWSDDVYKYLPAPAGMAVTAVRPDSSSLAPWAGFGVFCLYTAVVLGLAARRMHHRDA
jgi:ABC-type transport system involved in multi-copper enzyme maturation permease subunit